MEAGPCEQSDTRVNALLASEVTEDTTSLLDDGYQRGNVPWTCSHQKEGIQLTGRDKEAAMTGARSGGRFPGRRRGGIDRGPIEQGPGTCDMFGECHCDGALRFAHPGGVWPDPESGIVHVTTISDGQTMRGCR